MVEFSVVRLDYPSISFFFARLCSLLEAIRRHRPKVRLFMGRNCPLRFALCSLFPLVHCFVGFAQTLVMSREGKVRSSKLETGLSLSENRRALEVTSPLTPFKAWDICCTLKWKDEGRIRNRFQFPSLVKVKIPNDDDRACHSYTDKVCFYEANFVGGLRFPIHPFLRELFSHLLLAPVQLVPNSWRIVICCMVVWMSANDGNIIRMDEFLHLYHLRRSKDPSYWEFKPWDRSSRVILDSLSYLRN